MRGELAAGLVVLLQLLVVDGPDLSELVAVVRVLDGRLVAAGGRGGGVGRSGGTAALFGTWKSATKLLKAFLFVFSMWNFSTKDFFMLRKGQK